MDIVCKLLAVIAWAFMAILILFVALVLAVASGLIPFSFHYC